MQRFKLLFLFAFLIFGLTSVMAQEEEGLDNVINGFLMPSPESQEFIKNINSSVDLVSGKASLSVPLYALETPHMQVPISLNYSSGGIKVDEIATDVGLGWSLSAGGRVTRVVFGEADEVPGSGYLEQLNNIPWPFDEDDPDLHDKLNQFGDYGSDGQPDMFNYSIPGYSGKFILQPDGEVIQLTKSAVKIEWEKYLPEFPQDIAYSSYTFTITTPDGTIYTLGESFYEFTHRKNFKIDGYPDCQQKNFDFDVPTTWHLAKITSPKTEEEITFDYEAATVIYSGGYSESYSMPEAPNLDYCVGLFPGTNPDDVCFPRTNIRFSACSTRVEHNVKRIRHINSNYFKIDFEYVNGRADYGSGSIGPNRLENITVLARKTLSPDDFQQIKKYELVQSSEYSGEGMFATDHLNYRLYLKEVREIGIDGSQIPPYIFEYFAPFKLPSRLSFDQDHWGYYNGAGNTTFTPHEGELVGVEPANREASFTHSRFGMLKKAITPFNGIHEYNYESHDEYLPLTTECEYFYTPYSVGNNYLFSGPYVTTGFFTIPYDQTVPFNLEIAQTHIEDAAYISIIDEVTGNTVITWGGAATGEFSSTNPDILDIDNGSLYLPASTYIVVTEVLNEGEYLTFHLEYEDKICEEVVPHIPIGGLRIKSKTENGLKTTYTYLKDDEPESSSLVRMRDHRYKTRRLRDCGCREYSEAIMNIVQSYYVLSSSGVVNLYNSRGDHVNYSQVQEHIEGNGKTKNFFQIVPDVIGPPVDIDMPTYLGEPFNNMDRENGLLIRKEMFSESGFMFSEEEYFYDEEAELSNTVGFVCKENFEDCGLQPEYINEYDFAFYFIYSAFVEPTSTVTKNYFEDGSCFETVTTTEYELEDYNLINSTTTSGGLTQETTYKYPRQISATSMDIQELIMANVLIAANMRAIPIEVKTEGVTNSGSKTLYEGYHPNEFYSLNWQTQDWEFEGEIAEYNAEGYPLKVRRRGYDPLFDYNFEKFVWEGGLLEERISQEGEADERRTSYTYYDDRKLHTSIALDLQTTTYTYDTFKRLDQIITRGGNVVFDRTYQYAPVDGKNAVITTKTFLGTAASYNLNEIVEYDPAGRVEFTEEAGHLQGINKYDNLGRMTSSKAANAHFYNFSKYDGRVTERLLESGVEGWPTFMSFNESAITIENPAPIPDETWMMSETIDENGNISREYTNGIGQLVKQERIHNGNPVETTYEYDEGGNMKQVNPPTGDAYLYYYDGRNRLVAKTIPHEGTYGYTYTDRDEIETEAKPDGTMYEFIYNDFGENTITHINGAQSIVNSLGKSGILNGKLISKRVRLLDNSDWIGYEYEYDEYGRLEVTRITHPWGDEQIVTAMDMADFTTQTTRTHFNVSGSPDLIIMDDFTSDQYARTEGHYQKVNALPWQRIAENTYNDIDQVEAMAMGGLTGANPLNIVNYTYNMRDWLLTINELPCESEDGGDGSGDKTPPPSDEGTETTTTLTLHYNKDELLSYQPTRLELSFSVEKQSATGEVLYSNSGTKMRYLNGASNTADDIAFSNQTQVTANGEVSAAVLSEYLVQSMELGDKENPFDDTALKQNLEDGINDIEDSGSNEKTVYNHLFAERLTYIDADVSIGATNQYNGNISQIDWCIYGHEGQSTYSFKYDDLDRLERARFHQDENGTADPYGVHVVYADVMGNIQQIFRNGFVGPADDYSNQYGTMDNLFMEYTSNGLLQTVTEYANQNYGFKGTGSSYTYDAVGRLTQAVGRGINNIQYNEVGRPLQISTSEGTIDFLYDAEGTKWKQTTHFNEPPEAGLNVEEKVYVLGLEIVNGDYETLQNPNGRLIFEKDTSTDVVTPLQYEFTIRDHLGSPRVFFADVDGNGSIDTENNEVSSTETYYPYGAKFDGYGSIDNSSPRQPYKYNGKEEILLGQLDYGFRTYDPFIGQWSSVDPLAEDPNQIDKSPFAYTWNNPVKLTDPDGRCPQCVTGAVIGGGVEYGVQVVGNIYEKGLSVEAFTTDVDFGKVAISTAVGAATGGVSATSLVGDIAVNALGGAVESTLNEVYSVFKTGEEMKGVGEVMVDSAISGFTNGLMNNAGKETVKEAFSEFGGEVVEKAGKAVDVVTDVLENTFQKFASWME